ncbi:ATP-binding cassette domain-containing protein [Intestinibacter sp.]
MLEFKNVTGISNNKRGKVQFDLQNISFKLEKGYVMGLAGKNGAGKTTLLEYIMNKKAQYEGEILIDGENIKNNHVNILNYIGFVSGNNVFLDKHKVIENANLLGRLYKDWNQSEFEKNLERMGVSREMFVGNMSRGEFMKFQMAFAMAHNPKLYLIDEATSKMDPIFRREFYKIMSEIIEREDSSIVLVTHLEEELEFKVDYKAVMEKGRLVSFNEAI